MSGLRSRSTWGVRPHLELKQRALLSSQVATGISWSPLSAPGSQGSQGSQAFYGVLRGNLGLLSRPCRKRRASSCDDGGISFFLEFWREVWGFSRVTMGNSGSSRVAPGLHSICEGEHGIALESRQGNQALRCVEREITRSFSSCSRKPWVPSTCDSDLRELLRVPMGSQKYCDVGRGLSGLHWVWCNGRGPHLELRQ